MRALLSILALILAVGLALSAAGPAAAQPSPTIQLAVLLDGSVSVNATEWDTQISGLAAAINDSSYIPHDGSVQLTVIQFGGTLTSQNPPTYDPGAYVYISRTQITSANAGTVANTVDTTIRNNKFGDSTPLHEGILAAIDEIGGANAIDGARQIINISTNGGTNGLYGLPRDLAEQARDTAIADEIDEISAEGLGDIITTPYGTNNHLWLQGSIVYPEPGSIAPPFTPGWVYLGAAQDDGIQNAAEFTEAIGQKIPRYTLTVNSSGGGSVAKDPNQATYTYGTNVQLTATADTGWTFSAWSGDLTGSTNPDNINMDSSKTVTANFSSESNGDGDGGGGCFIATAAYGSYLDSHVETLRNFRDSYMVSNPVGSALVSTYYKLSPPVADFIDDHPTLKPVVRAGLLPAVAMSTVALNTTSAEKVAIVGSLALVSVALALWLSRRRGKGSRCEQPHQ